MPSTPVSFATEPYFGVHAFLFTNKDGKPRYGRYQFRPEAGTQFLAAEDAAKKHPNFLFDELTDRLTKGPVKFRLVVQLAAEGDPVDDAAAVWPDDRPSVELGTLSVTHPVANNDAAQRALGYDPMHSWTALRPRTIRSSRPVRPSMRLRGVAGNSDSLPRHLASSVLTRRVAFRMRIAHRYSR